MKRRRRWKFTERHATILVLALCCVLMAFGLQHVVTLFLARKWIAGGWTLAWLLIGVGLYVPGLVSRARQP